jgi:hypothetical protein
MAKFVVATTYPSNDPHVHKAGCADVTRGLARGKYAHAYTVECETPQDAGSEFWADIVAESDDVDAAEASARSVWTKFFPCTS